MDKLLKVLRKLTKKERDIIDDILSKLEANKISGLDIKKLKGQRNIFRARKGKIRIIYICKDGQINLLTIDRRNNNTYNNL